MILTILIVGSDGKEIRREMDIPAGAGVPREGDTVSTPDRALARVTGVQWHFGSALSVTIFAR